MGKDPSQSQTFSHQLFTMDNAQALQGAARFTANLPVI